MVASLALGKDATTTAFYRRGRGSVGSGSVGDCAAAMATATWRATAEALVRRRQCVDELVPLTFTKH